MPVEGMGSSPAAAWPWAELKQVTLETIAANTQQVQRKRRRNLLSMYLLTVRLHFLTLL